jgi:hypothetical protein
MGQLEHGRHVRRRAQLADRLPGEPPRLADGLVEELQLGAGEVLVDRAAGAVAALEDVGQPGPVSRRIHRWCEAHRHRTRAPRRPSYGDRRRRDPRRGGPAGGPWHDDLPHPPMTSPAKPEEPTTTQTQTQLDRTILEQPFELPNGFVVPNRLAKAALSEGLGRRDFAAGSRIRNLYRRWADSGVGLSITRQRDGRPPGDRRARQRRRRGPQQLRRPRRVGRGRSRSAAPAARRGTPARLRRP